MQNTEFQKPQRILSVEDDAILQKGVVTSLSSHFVIDTATNIEDAKKKIAANNYTAAVLDKWLGDVTSFELIPLIKDKNPKTGVVLFTTDDDLSSVQEALMCGADDYIIKSRGAANELPVRVTLAIKKANDRYASTQLKNRYLDTKIENTIIGTSKETMALKFEILKLKNIESNVMITGESGTGKEMIARAIHAIQDDSSRAFNVINCGAISNELFESELFGHMKGAFTNAYSDKKGLFELSNGGDLFLDEIGDLSLANQVKLLRALQSGEFKPVGANFTKKAEVRIIAATNKNLEKMIEEGTFREDLFYRINVVRFHTTPLRDRPDDIESLANHFIVKVSNGKSSLSHSALKLLQKQPYKGNVRELGNIIERAYINAYSSERNVLDIADFAFLSRPKVSKSNTIPSIPVSEFELGLKEFLKNREREYINAALERCGYSIENTIKAAQIGKSQFYEKLKIHNIKPVKTMKLETKGEPTHVH